MSHTYSRVASKERLENIENSSSARLNGGSNRYKALSLRIITLLKRDKESYVKGFAEDDKSCLNENDLPQTFEKALIQIHILDE